MSEIRINEVFMAGRIAQGPTETPDGWTHFLFKGSEDQEPFHCVCWGQTAVNLRQHCQKGDEVSLEGELRWMNFPNTGKTLVVYVRFTSYGRKLQSLREGPRSS